ncbi:MAG: adenylyltransferase/cytidyltransferase family protein [Candidatus Levybacteria bacterium]|nr:adenylyltransferase/cytidyltransferase family protein [Candidatus Levybacteria bacterium]
MVESIQKKTLPERESSYRIEVSQEELGKFLIPTISEDEVRKFLDKFKEKYKGKHKKALFIARMQPPHFGHLLAMKMALEVADNLVIGIGSSNVKGLDNPWTVEERQDMLEKALETNTDIKTRSRIIHLPDFFVSKDEYDDPKWVEETLQRVEGADVVVSRNPWVTGLLDGKMNIIKPPLFKREYFEGKKIRQALRNRK